MSYLNRIFFFDVCSISSTTISVLLFFTLNRRFFVDMSVPKENMCIFMNDVFFFRNGS